MLTRRIIPCMDIAAGRIVKGVQFANLRDMGDPVERAEHYAATGADELCFLDVTASIEERPLLYELISRVAHQVFVPLTVGGGVRSASDAKALLRAGADKVALNTAALADPNLIRVLADDLGSQCVVLSIDTLQAEEGLRVTTHGGRKVLDRTCLDWAAEGVERGAGEILLNVIDSDGRRDGFSLDITAAVADAVPVPVIASGGAGDVVHFVDVFRRTAASAALAASIFHDDTWTPNTLKTVLRDQQIEVRL